VLENKFEFEHRGPVYVKGKDNMDVYLLKGPKSWNLLRLICGLRFLFSEASPNSARSNHKLLFFWLTLWYFLIFFPSI